MPVSPVLVRWRQDDQEFKVILNYSESEANTSYMRLSLKKTEQGREKEGEIH